ncbi:MAG: TraM recognition site of TraD and TraG [Candidatus Omnitrophica bacterium ADurb.Bin277]|nr:MAG: TraM recognition site of TraD and TraG [Candidatus Omnitrophica bacterium ADurb.Bin277]
MSNMQPKPEPWVLRLLAGVFSAVPTGLADVLLALASKIRNPWFRKAFFSGVLGVSLASAVFFNRAFELLERFFSGGTDDPAGGTVLKLGLFYLFYVVVSLPVFLLIAYFGSHEKLFKGGSVKRNPGRGNMRYQRYRSSYGEVYLGESLSRSRSLFLTNEQREMHMQVVGSTGTGKTESVLLPMLAHDIAHGKGAIIIDGKGDKELLNRIRHSVVENKREKHFYFFSLAHPKDSHSYNPLLRGNATELKDKIIGSMAWSEEFYRRMAEQAALTILKALLLTNQKVRFKTLYACFTDLGSLKMLSDKTGAKNRALQMDLVHMINNFRDNRKFLSGLIADLYLSSRSEFSRKLDVIAPQIDLLKLYQEKKIAYFALDLQGYGDTAKRMGRMILQDLKTVSSYVQSNIPEKDRSFFPVFIDDAANFLDLGFMDFLSKSRAAKIGIALFHQSLGDLYSPASPNFQQQVIENTNIKIILRQDDPSAVEKFSKIAGTQRTLIPTYQTEARLMGKGMTGTGSVREGQAFKVEPDLIRELKRGEAVVIWKSPGFLAEHVRLDFFGHPQFPGTYKPFKDKDSEDEGPDDEIIVPEVTPPPAQGGIPPDVAAPMSVIEELEKSARQKKK